MGMFDDLFGSKGISLNNALTGIGTMTGMPIVSGIGTLLGSIFGSNETSQSQNTNASIKALDDMYKKYGIDPSKPFVSSEEKREDWSVNNARNQTNRAQNFQTLVSSQSDALNKALAQMGLSSGVGSSAMKVGVGTLAPLMQNYDAQDAALTMKYADPLRTTYEDRMKQFADIATTGAGSSSQNYTQNYRTDQLSMLMEQLKKMKAQQAGSNALDSLGNSKADTTYGLPWQTNIG